MVSFVLGLASLATASDQYGAAWIVAADFTGDGVGDLIVGDPGDADGVGRLYVFHGIESGNPLPPPTEADQVVSLSAQSLRACGYRLAQGCDLTLDGVPELWVGGKILRDNGQLDNRVLLVDPTRFEVLQDIQLAQDTPDFWDDLGDGCDFRDEIVAAFDDNGIGGGGGDSSGDPFDSSSSGDGVISFAAIALSLFSFNPWEYGSNVGKAIASTETARSGAKSLYPIDDTMSEAQKKEAQWKRNGARHALWQGLLTFHLNADLAGFIGDCHEAESDNELDTWIDQYNNQVARDIAIQCLNEVCTLEELIRHLLEGLEDGRFILSPCDPRVPAELRQDPSRSGGILIICSGYGGPVALGDVNSDGSTNVSDWYRLTNEIGSDHPVADLDHSGIVDPLDAAVLADILNGGS